MSLLCVKNCWTFVHVDQEDGSDPVSQLFPTLNSIIPVHVDQDDGRVHVN
ncbi:hypothetical protein KA478_00915 [Patescibacteria group bacterium]|nr:hypothetical protein [Patescibacteria group bacterium]